MFEDFSELKIKYNEKTKNVKIVNSYLIKKRKSMQIYLIFNYLTIRKVNRSIPSCLNEWVAHNRLYRLGLFKERCRDTDFTMNESLFRRICYWILSRGAR